MGWNTEERAAYFLNALEDMKNMLTDFDNAEDWEHAKTTARCLAWLSGNNNWFEVSHEYWKKQQQKEIREDIAKKEMEKKMAKPISKDTIEELHRRKTLGIPLEDKSLAEHYGVWELGFTSEESFRVFDEWFKNYIKALQEISKGEPVDIAVLRPLLGKGWAAMDKNGDWFWYSEKPISKNNGWVSAGSFDCCDKEYHCERIGGFNIKPADDWKTSLMECGL